MPSQTSGVGDPLDVRACVGYIVLMSAMSQYLQSLTTATHNLKVVGSNPTPATTVLGHFLHRRPRIVARTAANPPMYSPFAPKRCCHCKPLCACSKESGQPADRNPVALVIHSVL